MDYVGVRQDQAGTATMIMAGATMFQLFKPNLQKGPFYVTIFMGLKERQIKKEILPIPQSSSSEPSPQLSFPSQRFFSETHLLFLHATCPDWHPP